MTPPPRLELFQKFIRFGIAALPLLLLPTTKDQNNCHDFKSVMSSCMHNALLYFCNLQIVVQWASLYLCKTSNWLLFPPETFVLPQNNPLSLAAMLSLSPKKSHLRPAQPFPTMLHYGTVWCTMAHYRIFHRAHYSRMGREAGPMQLLL